ncbi:MAG: sigma factor-like helix-turn-helix DNA-binding protein [Psychrobacillus sp.]
MYFPDLLEEYKQLLKQMRSEGVTSGSMFQEVKQAIEWMETGYDPAEYRAATRVDAYPMDPYHMQTYMAYVNDDEMLMPEFLLNVNERVHWELRNVDEVHEQFYFNRYTKDLNDMVSKAASRKKKLSGAMKGLTADEKAVFVAIEAERIQFSKVARMLDVSKSTVQSYYSRAKRKIHANITHGTQENLFEVG